MSCMHLSSDGHVVGSSARVVAIERCYPPTTAETEATTISPHPSDVDAKHRRILGGWLLPSCELPPLYGYIYPLLGDKYVVANLGEASEYLFAEQVLGAIPLPLELKIV